MIKQFLESVAWGDLDYLVIDTPPGTSDEHIAVVELLQQHRKPMQAVLVTTPQLIAVQDVEKEVTFCERVGVPVAGVIENMSGYVCPHCSTCTNVFSSGGGEWLATTRNLPFLGRVPISARIARLFNGTSAGGDDVVAEYERSDAYPLFTEILGKIGKQP